MPIELFFVLIIGGPLFIGLGLIALVYKLYKLNWAQGAVADINPVMAIFFGLKNWNQTKAPILLILAGLLMLGVIFLV